jgi:hypothetical protein
LLFATALQWGFSDIGGGQHRRRRRYCVDVSSALALRREALSLTAATGWLLILLRSLLGILLCSFVPLLVINIIIVVMVIVFVIITDTIPAIMVIVSLLLIMFGDVLSVCISICATSAVAGARAGGSAISRSNRLFPDRGGKIAPLVLEVNASPNSVEGFRACAFEDRCPASDTFAPNTGQQCFYFAHAPADGLAALGIRRRHSSTARA